MNDMFAVHSGAGRKYNRWGVWCPSGPLPLWWRLEDSRSHPITFATYEAAQRACDRLNPLAEIYRYARDRAQKLREYHAADWNAWEGINRYPGVRSSLWGADPMGLFTADLTRPFSRWSDPDYIAERARKAAA